MRTEWIWISADDSEAILYPIMGPEDGLERMKWMQDMIGGYFTPYPLTTVELFLDGVSFLTHSLQSKTSAGLMRTLRTYGVMKKET